MLLRIFPLIFDAFGQFFHFALIVLVMGVVALIVGELLPRKYFDYTAFPFRPFRWEKNGEIYEQLHIRKWKDRLPDMSKYIRSMVAKKMISPRNPRFTHRLILETCIAELVHGVLILLSPIFTQHLSGFYGEIAMVLYALGNVPFILIQRYNRPRLVMLIEKQLAAQQRVQSKTKDNDLCTLY